jgi:hypothetical protein
MQQLDIVNARLIGGDAEMIGRGRELSDLLSASRYAMMMLRYARPAQDDAWSKPIKYGPSGLV